MSLKAYAAGSSAPPPPVEGGLRLYSMRFCPFAKRVRLVLAHKKIQHETININLEKKPEWYLQLFPEGKVPAIQMGERFLNESDIVCEYLDEAYEGHGLLPSDPFTKAKDKILLTKFSPITQFIYKNFHGAGQTFEQLVETILPVLTIYEKELESRKSKYFGGKGPSMLDFLMWPWFEMFTFLPGVFENITVDAIVSKEQFPNVREWMDTMQTVPAVQECSATEFGIAFLEGMKTGKRNYDVGL